MEKWRLENLYEFQEKINFFFFFLFFMDRFTKLFFLNIDGSSKSIYLNRFLNLEYVRNYGIAFGLVSNESNFFYFLVFFVGLLTLYVLIFFVSVGYNDKDRYLCYFMILAGAFGNLIDRLIYGYIIDFIDLHVGRYHFPTFNTADFSIFLGEIFLILRIFFKKGSNVFKDKKK
ncbi:signal peptidase II [Candidatus Riesia pediculicola]|uniref:signal peptidase II n=1 Tax=Candidatus Riesia pediculicola TaxID=401619 RepID=UPI0009C3C5F0|nr:signal peptidase II [Candidatus Riesia pediculicola]ARC54420.1 hypothetical protein AOE57_02465 [Candidatus Riesia pediculicola]